MRVGEKLLSTSGVEVDGSFSFIAFDLRVQRVKACVYTRVDHCRITVINKENMRRRRNIWTRD